MAVTPQVVVEDFRCSLLQAIPEIVHKIQEHSRHFSIVIEECSHLVNSFTAKCGCIGLILFRYLSCLAAIICDINTIGFVLVCMENL